MKKTLLFLTTILVAQCLTAQENWMRYPSISPDGKSIAFAYQGDIFLVDVNGGEARQLTSHSAHDFMPVWSGDGQNIAFSSNRAGNFDVYIMSANGGTPKRLTFHSSPDYPYDFKSNDTEIVFGSMRLDDPKSMQFPTPVLGELYSVSVNGGREKQELTIAAEQVSYSAQGKYMLFHDKKGYEDQWRKHQVSSVARDIFLMDTEKQSFRKLTDWEGEDRNPIFGENNNYYFLSEKSGTFNVWQGNINGSSYEKQLTDFSLHPVRFLSRSKDGVLCFGYHGNIYTLVGDKLTEVPIKIVKDNALNDIKILPIGGMASEFQLSPNGKEVVFVNRGEVYVASIEFGTTKRITNTPEQERNVSFSPDGKSILFAGERNKSWNIYQVTKVNDTEKYFYNASLLKEETLIETPDETFDPKFSPNGEEIAFLSNRTTLQVYNLKSKQIRTVLPGTYNYSYSDGDQYYTWAPDSKHLLVQFFEFGRWTSDVGIVDASGKSAPLNLTQSGYGSGNAKFAMDGQMVYYSTDKYGYRSHGSWGAESDVEAIFLTKDAFYKFTLNEQDYKAWKELDDEKKEKEKSDTEAKDKKKKDKKEEETKPAVRPLKIELEGLYDRKVRLTIHSNFLSDFVINNEGTEMYYMPYIDQGFDIWVTKFKTSETRLFQKCGSWGSSLLFDKEEKNLFFVDKGGLEKLEVASSKLTPIAASSEFNWNASEERAYMFEHAWRQVREKFYVADLHGVNWDLMKKEYEPKLKTINNGFDFSEMLSEMLGELNASHTGAFYRGRVENPDQTAHFACYFDESYQGDGLKIVEIMDKSPLLLNSTKVVKGTIIEKIDGEAILKNQNYYALLNRKAGKKVWVSFYNPSTNERWSENIVPIHYGELMQLAYERWIKKCEAIVDSVSGGQIGYVHIEGMDSESFRKLYDKALGKLNKKKALIVDTRFNGGGWLHDDLATFLSGKLYMSFEPRGQKNMGGEPIAKWQKPSAVLMSEGNYSDAHLFPYTYKALEIGPLIGMPVPGTGTAVWWETMIDGQTTFGIPQIGMRSVKENVLVENHELEPDYKVNLDYSDFTKGKDAQLLKAIEVLMK